ncbi:hypothetical protein GCM10018790_13240 [Kitasatospora xanthocidica]|nr:hypothetical protein GCM10018790_13240 [Kitasatospora xanthocidica]
MDPTDHAAASRPSDPTPTRLRPGPARPRRQPDVPTLINRTYQAGSDRRGPVDGHAAGSRVPYGY